MKPFKSVDFQGPTVYLPEGNIWLIILLMVNNTINGIIWLLLMVTIHISKFYEYSMG